MIKFENTEVMGWEAAIRGMRNPMNSWEKNDSLWAHYDPADAYEYYNAKEGAHYKKVIGYRDEDDGIFESQYYIGPDDQDLMMKLRNAGTDHRKFMRMITVYTDITAPLYW